MALAATACLPLQREGVCATDDECPGAQVCAPSTHTCRNTALGDTNAEDVSKLDSVEMPEATDVADGADGPADATDGVSHDAETADADGESPDTRKTTDSSDVTEDGGDPACEFGPGASKPGPPTDFPPAFWLRADKSEVAEGKVRCWRDLSGNGKHFSSATDSSGEDRAPAFEQSVEAISGKPAVRFDGQQEIGMQTPGEDTTETAAATIYLVLEHGPSYPGQLLSGCGGDCDGVTCNVNHQVRFDAEDALFFNRASTGTETRISGLNPAPWQILKIVFGPRPTDSDLIEIVQIIGGETEVRLDDPIGDQGPWRFNTIGSHCGENGLNARIAEILFYDTELSSDESDKVVTHLGTRYGIEVP